MHLSIIAAMAKNRVIGRENTLPWHLPADLKYFKKTTWGKPVIMGRKTYQSIGHALPGRLNIVVSRSEDFQAQDCELYASLDAAIKALETKNHDEIMIIGGASLFEQVINKVDRMYLTMIHQDFSGDTYFPTWNADEWSEIKRQDFEPDEKNAYHYSFVLLERSGNASIERGNIKR